MNYIDDDYNVRIPMSCWSNKNVVAAIERASYEDENGDIIKLNHFCSVFHQFMIDGKELVVMNVLHIELLVEVWFLKGNGVDVE